MGKGWYGDKQKHSLASRGIKVNWRIPTFKDVNFGRIEDETCFDKITDLISFKDTQEMLRENKDALIVDAVSPSGIEILDGADGVNFKSSKFATYWTDDRMRFRRGSVRDHLDKFTELTGEENVQLLLTSGRKAYTNAKLKNVKFQLAIPKEEFKKGMNKRYRNE